jgi:hypothetical protein
MGVPVPLDRVSALAFDTPGNVRVEGLVSTSIDGSTFDPAFTWDGLVPGASHAAVAGGLFDAAAGGLRLVEQHVDRHVYVYAPTGELGPGCVLAGVSSPCLVPRLASLAHDRLRTQTELEASLAGSIQVDEAGLIAPEPVRDGGGVLVIGVFFAGLLALGLAIARWLLRRAATPLGRVRAAARGALRELRGDGDVSRAPLRAHVRAMVARAVELDAAHRACTHRLRSIDRVSLERRRATVASAPPARAPAETICWLDQESQETSRLEDDAAAAVLGIQRIESALRVVALRLREHRGVPVRAPRFDPVDAAASELGTRDDAIAETDAALDSSIIN